MNCAFATARVYKRKHELDLDCALVYIQIFKLRNYAHKIQWKPYIAYTDAHIT